MKSQLKRKMIKVVKFNLDQVKIIETYSSSEYDRGKGLGSLYKVNPNLPLLSLDIPTSTYESDISSPELESPPPPTTTLDFKKKKPRLTVNTSCTDGPLFFTKLSTHHNKFMEDDENNQYLIPMTPLSTTPNHFIF